MPNHFMKLWKRGLALLLAGVLLFSNLSGSLAFAESTPSQETTEATAETAETADTASLSEQAQAFVEAVAALDRDSMVAASNDWGLAHQAWMADLDNAVLESKLNEAIAVQEETCAPLYAAEDLYNQILEEERSDDRVQDAYAVWAAILAATYAAMENPVATGAGGEPDLAEITEMLYDDLPDEPTGSYIGSMGLPIATGQTRISISEWMTDLYDGVDAHTSPVARQDHTATIKSVGNSGTTPRDLVNDEDVWLMLLVMSESVAMRMRELGMKCTVVEVSIRDSNLMGFVRQRKIETPTNGALEIARIAFELFKSNYRWGNPLRGVGVRGTGLVPEDCAIQLGFFSNQEKREQLERLDKAVDTVRQRYGYTCVQRARIYTDRGLGQINPKDDHTVHPVGFFHAG